MSTAAGPTRFRVGLTDDADPISPTAVPLYQSRSEEGAGGRAVSETMLDWRFVDPPVSVGATLIQMFDAAMATCREISSVAGLQP